MSTLTLVNHLPHYVRCPGCGHKTQTQVGPISCITHTPCVQVKCKECYRTTTCWQGDHLQRMNGTWYTVS